MIHPLFINLYRYLFFLTGILPASRIPHPASALIFPYLSSRISHLLISALICPYLPLSALICSYLHLSAHICTYLLLSRISHLLLSALAPTASAIGAKTNRMRHRQYYRYSYIGCALHPETW